MILVTGGARSGKSAFAEKRCSAHHRVAYIATARPSPDPEMRMRIEKHRRRRPSSWETIETDRDFLKKIKDVDAVLLDCVTVMISNYLFERGSEEPSEEDIRAVENRAIGELDALIEGIDARGNLLYIVTNEVGSGLVPMHPLSRAFRDIQGRVNQHLAQKAEQVYLCVSGIPVKIK